MTVLMPKRRNQKLDAILRVYFTHIHMTVLMPKSRNQKLDAMYRVSADTSEKRRDVSRLYRIYLISSSPSRNIKQKPCRKRTFC